MRKNSKRTAAKLRRIKFESRGELLDYLHSQGVRWTELNKLKKK